MDNTETMHQIAVLGLDAVEVRNDGLQTVYLADTSSYILFTGDWRAYVAALNAEAERWLKEHRLGENRTEYGHRDKNSNFPIRKERIDAALLGCVHGQPAVSGGGWHRRCGAWMHSV